MTSKLLFPHLSRPVVGSAWESFPSVMYPLYYLPPEYVSRVVAHYNRIHRFRPQPKGLKVVNYQDFVKNYKPAKMEKNRFSHYTTFTNYIEEKKQLTRTRDSQRVPISTRSLQLVQQHFEVTESELTEILDSYVSDPLFAHAKH